MIKNVKDENCKTGKALPVLHNQMIHLASGKEIVISTVATMGIIEAKIAAIKPITVMGAITGEAKTLAKILIKDNCPESATITGVQKIVAEIGIATASANTFHLNLALSCSTNLGDKINIPAVAKTERAKPGSIA
jgi:hypothetical protein